MFRVMIIDRCKEDFLKLKKEINWELLDVSEIALADNYDDVKTSVKAFMPDVIICDLGDAFQQLIALKAEIPYLTNIIFWGTPPNDLSLLNTIKNLHCDFTEKPLNAIRMTQLIKKDLTIIYHEKENENKIKIFENEVTRLMPTLQENVIRDLLFTGPRLRKYHSDIELELESIGLKPDGLCGVVATQLNDDIDVSEENLLMQSHLHMLKLNTMITYESKSMEMRIFSSVMDYKTIASLVYFNKNISSVEAQNMLIDFFQKIKDMSLQTLGINVSVAVGAITDDISKSHEALLNANKALEFIGTGGFKSIVLADDIKNTLPVTEYDMQMIKNEIEQMIDARDEASITAFAEKYFSASYLVSENSYRSMAFTVISVTQIILYERNESFASIFEDEMVLWKKILNFESIYDIKNLITNILITAMKFLSEQQNKHHHQIVHDIKKIIETEYAAIENVSEITEKLYLSKNHANYIFKNYTGKNIFDYLIRTRMEKAKEFLNDERYKIYEVAQMVGYKNNAYFTVVFKAYVGMTPNEFRKKINIDNSSQ